MAKKKTTPVVKIETVERYGNEVVVRGTSECLGERRVEVIVNGDLNRRYVARGDENGAWKCRFTVDYNGTYKIEASIRDYSDFNKIRQTTPDNNYFLLDGATVWGSTVTKHTDGLYYMIFANWDKHDCFRTDWYEFSELGCAVSTRVGGPYVYRGKALDAAYSNTTHKAPVIWNQLPLDVFHNPNLMKSERDGKYYLYFMGTTGNLEPKKSHSLIRNGVAWADTPMGPWTVMPKPVIDVREHWEHSMTSNPAVTEVKKADGSYEYYAVYKGSGTYDGQRLTATGYGRASDPKGPFVRGDAPIMRDPEVGFSVEDCFVWHHNGKYYSLAKDMTKGNWTGVKGVYSYALFESEDGENWGLSENKLAFKNEILWESGKQFAKWLERSQLYVEDTVPFLITNATTINGESPYLENQAYNVQTPLLGVAMTTDEAELAVTDLGERHVDKATLRVMLERARTASREDYSLDNWRKLKSAMRAAEVVLARSSSEKWDVDFVVGELNANLK